MTVSPGSHRTVWAGVQYVLFRSGPVASRLFETGGFWYADPDARSPDIQFHLGLGSGIEAGVARLKNAGVTLNSAYLHPRSRGTVRLAGADPAAAPLIDPNYWADPHDRAMSLEGLRLAREIMRQPAPQALYHGRTAARTWGRQRGRAVRLCLYQRQDRSPSGRHLPDGRRAAWPWSGRTSRCMASTDCGSAIPR